MHFVAVELSLRDIYFGIDQPYQTGLCQGYFFSSELFSNPFVPNIQFVLNREEVLDFDYFLILG